MNKYAPYRMELSYEIASCMRTIDLEPSHKVERVARNVTHLQD